MSSVNRTPDFTIAPWGIDTNPGTDESPFATLERARGAVRELAAREPGKDILVSVRGGTYRLGRTVVFGLEDSAGDGRTITYAAHPGETPVFSAGVPISNWRKLEEDPPHIDPKAKGKLWVADIPEALERDLPVTALYDGIEALPRARGKGFPLENDESEVSDDVRRSELRFPEGAFGEWPDITNGDVVVIPRYTWTMNILPVESVDFETRTARTRFPHTYPMLPNRRDEAVWLENVLGVLTSPGEWVYDRKAGRIYLWPRTTEPGTEIVYPALTEMIRIEGSVDYDGPEDTPVRGIRFLGLTFTHGERFQWYGKTGWGIQHDWEAFDRPTAMIRFRGAEECGVGECRFTAAACTAVRLDLHCRNNRITANLIDHVGGSGILLCGYGPGLKDVNRGNEVSDNHIHHIGEVIWHAPAIFVWQSGDNRIAHNHIHHTGYTGIVVSGRIRWDREGIMECSRTVRWKETAEVVGPDYEQQVWHQAWYPDWKRREPLYHGRNNIVEYNDIHHVMQIMGDGNGVYISGTGSGNVMRFNIVHDCPSPTMAEALRCDDDQHETTIHGNLLYGIGGMGTGITTKGLNHITNNIIASPCVPKTARGLISLEVGPLYGSIVRRNILYATSAGQSLYFQYRRIHGEGPSPLLRDCDADLNLYWCTEDPSRCKRHLEIERRFGIEGASVVADPMFVDPERGDFRLETDSPAFGLGFEAIDYGAFGPTDALPKRYR